MMSLLFMKLLARKGMNAEAPTVKDANPGAEYTGTGKRCNPAAGPADRAGTSAETGRHLIVHNIGAGPPAEDVLFRWEIIGHCRCPAAR